MTTAASPAAATMLTNTDLDFYGDTVTALGMQAV